MIRLKNWTAIRSGAFITLEGMDDKDVTKKFTGIIFIQSGNQYPLAEAEDGTVIELLNEDN